MFTLSFTLPGLKPLPNEFSVIIIKNNLTTSYQLLLNCNKVHRAGHTLLVNPTAAERAPENVNQGIAAKISAARHAWEDFFSLFAPSTLCNKL
jgi:hypothetical protein